MPGEQEKPRHTQFLWDRGKLPSIATIPPFSSDFQSVAWLPAAGMSRLAYSPSSPPQCLLILTLCCLVSSLQEKTRAVGRKCASSGSAVPTSICACLGPPFLPPAQILLEAILPCPTELPCSPLLSVPRLPPGYLGLPLLPLDHSAISI